MTLKHSPLGLDNKRKFFGVDIIVYVEGAPPKNADERKPIQSVDVGYWRAIFTHFLERFRVRFEPKGGKKALLEIADTLVNTAGCGTIVAMDADFDLINHNHIRHECVFYTHGYGWENDIFNLEVMRRVFYQYCHVCETEYDPSEELRGHISRIEKETKLLCLADLVSMVGVRGLIPRDKPTSCVQVLVKKEDAFTPSINKRWVFERLMEINAEKQGKYFRARKVGFNSIQLTYCHLMGKIMSMILSDIIKTHSHGQLPTHDNIMSSAINVLKHSGGEVLLDEVSDFYRRQADTFCRYYQSLSPSASSPVFGTM